MSNPTILTCWTVSGDAKATSLQDAAIKEGQILHQEKGKKSSFLFDLDDSLLERPDKTQIVVENNPEEQNHFFLGGFQIVSNAKQLKVYLTARDGKESYLTTSRGIPFDKPSGKQWYKAVCVVPGGPRLITRVRLEIMNVQPHKEGDDTTLTKIRYLKLTARIPVKTTTTSSAAPPPGGQLGAAPMPKIQPDASSAFSQAPPSLSAMFQGQNGSAFVPTNPPPPSSLGAMSSPMMAQALGGHPGAAFLQAPQMQAAPPPLTQDDLGAAMAGISMMARSTQESMEKSFQKQAKEMREHMDAQWGTVQGYIGTLSQVVVSQKTVLEENNKIMQQQHTMVAEQSLQIKTLIQQQTVLQSTVQSLQSDMKELQQQVGKSLDAAAESQTAAAVVESRQQPQQQQASQDVLQAVAKTAIAEQQAAISPAIESIQTNMESLSEYIKQGGNQTQDLLSGAIENIQTDVKALKKVSEESNTDAPNLQQQQQIQQQQQEQRQQQQEERLSSTLESLKSEMSQLRQSIEDDSGKRDQMSTAIENVQSSLTKLEQVEPNKADPNVESSLQEQQQQHQALSASVDVLEKDVATLRESMENTSHEGSSQQKALQDNLDSLKWDLSEMQRSIQEHVVESATQQAAVEEESSNPEVKEIVLTGIRDFDTDIFAIRSLEAADESFDNIDDGDDEKKEEQLQEENEEEEIQATMESRENEIEVPLLPRPLTPDRPPRPNNPVLKESLVLKQSIEALKEFREIAHNKDGLKAASSGDSMATPQSVNSTSTPPTQTDTPAAIPPSPPTPPTTNVSGKPPRHSNATSTPPTSLSALVKTGSLMDEEELIEGEIVETDISFGDGFIVSVETLDATTGAPAIAGEKVETKEAGLEGGEYDSENIANSEGSAKRSLGSLVMEPNGSLVVDVDEDGTSLDDIDLTSLGKEGQSGDGDKGVAVKENTSDNVARTNDDQEGAAKDGKRVSFRDNALEDRYEYSPEIQKSGSSASTGAESADDGANDGILEMGMKLFNSAGWL